MHSYEKPRNDYSGIWKTRVSDNIICISQGADHREVARSRGGSTSKEAASLRQLPESALKPQPPPKPQKTTIHKVIGWKSLLGISLS